MRKMKPGSRCVFKGFCIILGKSLCQIQIDGKILERFKLRSDGNFLIKILNKKIVEIRISCDQTSSCSIIQPNTIWLFPKDKIKTGRHAVKVLAQYFCAVCIARQPGIADLRNAC